MTSNTNEEATLLLARRVLLCGVAALAYGLGVLAVRDHGPIAEYLFLYSPLSDQQATQIEYLGGQVLLIIIPFLFFRRLWFLILFIPCWVLAAAWSYRTDTSAYGDLVWGAHAIRYLAPIALVLLCWQPPALSNQSVNHIAMTLLKIGIAATFAFHGIEALLLLPEFLDYAQSAVSVTGVLIGNDKASAMLYCIGCWDICLAATALFSRWRFPLYAMAIWGAATACLRLLDGWSYYPETVLRIIHVIPPITILILYRLDESNNTQAIKGQENVSKLP